MRPPIGELRARTSSWNSGLIAPISAGRKAISASVIVREPPSSRAPTASSSGAGAEVMTAAWMTRGASSSSGVRTGKTSATPISRSVAASLAEMVPPTTIGLLASGPCLANSS